ncbi:MAG: zinc ribbon domain-containing protein [Patescibacteria group bacterium]
MDNTLLCPVCQYKIQADWFFCPNCAKELKEKIPVISIGKQIMIYFVSFFFSPLGLGWGLKYVKSKDSKIKTIGIISIILTFAAIIFMIGAAKSFIDQYAKILNNIVPSY